MPTVSIQNWGPLPDLSGKIQPKFNSIFVILLQFLISPSRVISFGQWGTIDFFKYKYSTKENKNKNKNIYLSFSHQHLYTTMAQSIN